MKLEDLQENWNRFGRTDPLWGILAWPDKAGGRWQVDEFFATGVEEINAALAYVKALGLALPQGAALDFGCGVGRLTQALAGHFTQAHGVDISREMIDLARRYNRHGERCRYHLNEADDLSLFADASFDFIYSNITLQHMPPRFARRYLGEFLRLLTPSGVLLFQLPSQPVSRLRRLIQPLRPTWIWRSYQRLRYGSQPVMDMYGIARPEVVALLASLGGRVIDAQPDANADAHWHSFRYCVTKTMAG